MSSRRLSSDQIESAVSEIRRELETVGVRTPDRIDCSPDNIEQGLAKLVLGLIELLRRLLERQAIRRMEGGSLDDAQIEAMARR